MDTATIVALIGLIGTIMGGVATIIVAIYTNRSEKQQTAETTLEKTLRERILLRDEQLAECGEDLAAAVRERDEARQERDRLQLFVDECRAEEKELTDGPQ